MAEKKPLKELEGLSVFGAVENALVAAQAASSGGICDFVDNILDGFGVPLWLSQRVILKTMYSEPLNEEEQELADKWVRDNKTNYMEPAVALGIQNAMLAGEGEDQLKEFNYQLTILQCGMRASKSSTVALAVAYEFFKYVTMDEPQKYLGVSRSSPIYITVVASTERQTKGTLYYYVKEYIQKSTFFKRMIDDGTISVKELEIECPSKGVIISCGHSRATSIVGRTAIMVAFDELAMFSADDGHTSNAQDVFQRIGRSTATYKEKAKRIALSSVKESGDFMETLVKEEFNRQPGGSLVFDLTTFDINPTLSKHDSAIAGDYIRDRASAERDYENIRPSSASAFMIPAIVERCGTLDPQEICAHSQIEVSRSATDREGNVLEEREHVAMQVAVVPDSNVESYGHVDFSLVRDSTGFACGHPDWVDEGVVTVIPIVIEWLPRQLGKGRVAKVDFGNVDDVVLQVAKARNMVELTYDQWNSASSIQLMFKEGIIAKDASFSAPLQKRMYDSLRKRMNAGLVKFPNHPTLIEELKNLELQNGDKVNHPKNKDSTIPGRGKISKDLADCIAAVNWLIVQRYDVDFERDSPQSSSLYNQSGGGAAGGSINLIGRSAYGGAPRYDFRYR